MEHIIKVENLQFGYNNSLILKGINIEIYQGDFVSIVGENGSGKSTLLKCLLGLNKGYLGTVQIKNLAGYLPQRNIIQNNFPATIYEVAISGTNCNAKTKLFYSKADKEKAKNALESVGMWVHKNECFRELSGGQQQRTLIARALCASDKLLILDEPVSGLDPGIVNEIYELLRKLNKEKGTTIVMVSHDTHRALNYCNRVIKIENGKKAFDDTVKTYKESTK
jgi:zinc transport system ATP-binding protein